MALLLKNLLFTFLVPGTVAVLVPWLLTGDAEPRSGASLPIAALLLAVGASIYVWCVWDFASFGRATPAPIDAPTRLVVRGLYRFSRNPMYVGVLAVILGQAVLFRSPGLAVYGAVVATCFQAFVLLYEEPHLEAEFGSEYTSYKSRVGRWLPRPQPGDRRLV